MDNIVLRRSSCWPWWHPGESPTFIFHEEYILRSIEHARTAYHETCGTKYQQPYRRCNSQTPYYKRNIESAPSERVLRTTQLAKLSFKIHRSYSQVTFFNIFINVQIIGNVNFHIYPGHRSKKNRRVNSSIQLAAPWKINDILKWTVPLPVVVFEVNH